MPRWIAWNEHEKGHHHSELCDWNEKSPSTGTGEVEKLVIKIIETPGRLGTPFYSSVWTDDHLAMSSHVDFNDKGPARVGYA